MFILGIITARGGSKGIKDKNIKPLLGKPLIVYSIENGLQSRWINALVVSTDSMKIKECAEKFGIKINTLRPDYLATDTAKSLDVIQYEIEQFEKRTQQQIDIMVLLQPTSPLRTAQDIDNAIEIFQKSNSESLISVCQVSHAHPFAMYQKEGEVIKPLLGDHQGQRRQDYPIIYVRNGAIYISKRRLIMEKNRLICENPAFYLMPQERSVNIDEPSDFKLAEFFMSQKNFDLMNISSI